MWNRRFRRVLGHLGRTFPAIHERRAERDAPAFFRFGLHAHVAPSVRRARPLCRHPAGGEDQSAPGRGLYRSGAAPVHGDIGPRSVVPEYDFRVRGRSCLFRDVRTQDTDSNGKQPYRLPALHARRGSEGEKRRDRPADRPDAHAARPARLRETLFRVRTRRVPRGRHAGDGRQRDERKLSGDHRFARAVSTASARCRLSCGATRSSGTTCRTSVPRNSKRRNGSSRRGCSSITATFRRAIIWWTDSKYLWAYDISRAAFRPLAAFGAGPKGAFRPPVCGCPCTGCGKE